MPAGVRLAYSHVVVLDSFFGEPERDVLLCQLTEPGWNPSQVCLLLHSPLCSFSVHLPLWELARSGPVAGETTQLLLPFLLMELTLLKSERLCHFLPFPAKDGGP